MTADVRLPMLACRAWQCRMVAFVLALGIVASNLPRQTPGACHVIILVILPTLNRPQSCQSFSSSITEIASKTLSSTLSKLGFSDCMSTVSRPESTIEMAQLLASHSTDLQTNLANQSNHCQPCGQNHIKTLLLSRSRHAGLDLLLLLV